MRTLRARFKINFGRVLSANSPTGCSAKSACHGSRLRARRGGPVRGHPRGKLILKRALRSAAALISLLGVVVIGTTAGAAQLTLIASTPMTELLEAVLPTFERDSGHMVKVMFLSGSALPDRIKEGAPADLVVTLPETIDDLVKAGKIVPGSRVDFMRSSVGVAVRAGAPKPDISTVEGFKNALLAAKSITYLNPAQDGESGFLFTRVLDRLGIASEMKSKTVIPKTTGAVAAVVVNGDAEIAVLALQHIQFISGAGIELVGPLPSDVQERMVFSAAIMTGARNTEASKALLNFLRTPEATTVMKAKGMEPA